MLCLHFDPIRGALLRPVSETSHPAVSRVVADAEAKGIKIRIVHTEKTARSAKEAAEALSVSVGEIVKSLVFRGKDTGKAYLLLVSGANRVDEALAAYQAVITQAGTSTEASVKGQKYAAVLGKSTCLIRKQGQASYETALKDLEGVLTEVPDSNSQVLAEAYLRQGDCLRLLGRQKAAVLAYLHVDLLFAAQAPLHAESLYHLGTLWSAVGHPERAASARERLRSDYPESPWTKKLGS